MSTEPKQSDCERITLTVRETAQELRISERHIWKLVSRGVLRPIRLGRAVRFLRADLLDALERLRE